MCVLRDFKCVSDSNVRNVRVRLAQINLFRRRNADVCSLFFFVLLLQKHRHTQADCCMHMCQLAHGMQSIFYSESKECEDFIKIILCKYFFASVRMSLCYIFIAIPVDIDSAERIFFCSLHGVFPFGMDDERRVVSGEWR